MSQDDVFVEPRDLYARKVGSAIWAPGPYADLYLRSEMGGIEWRIRPTNEISHLDDLPSSLVPQVVGTLGWISDQYDSLYDWLVLEERRRKDGNGAPIAPPDVTKPSTSIQDPIVGDPVVGSPGQFTQVVIPGDFGKLTLRRDGSLMWESTELSYGENVATFHIPSKVAQDAMASIGRLINQFFLLRSLASAAKRASADASSNDL